MSRTRSPGALVALDRDPLDQLDSPPARAVVAALAERLRADGLCRLPGFLTTAATALLAVEAEALAPLACRGMATQSPDHRKDGADYPPGHPRVTWQSRGLVGGARSLGAEGIRVEQPGDIRAALEQALALHRPCLIDVVSDSYTQAPHAYLGD